MLGTWGTRNRAWERDEALADRALLRLPFSQLSRRQRARLAEARKQTRVSLDPGRTVPPTRFRDQPD